LGWLARARRLALGRQDEAGLPLYTAAVARGREPHWYLDGAVPDTVDGRFDTLAAVLSVVLLRLEAEPGPNLGAGRLSVAATERFVDDMDGQLRQAGIGDITVGKHIGRMMSALGGRLGAYRDGLAAGDLKPALVRNLYRGEAPPPAALAHVEARLLALRDALAATPHDALEEGRLP
jgi:cytochrome b pre-mRNA-processing protein 3